MPGEYLERLARPYIPQANGIVRASGCKSVTIRTKDNTVNVRNMSCKYLQLMSCRYIPQADSIVSTSGCQHGAIRIEYHACDRIYMICEDFPV